MKTKIYEVMLQLRKAHLNRELNPLIIRINGEFYLLLTHFELYEERDEEYFRAIAVKESEFFSVCANCRSFFEIKISLIDNKKTVQRIAEEDLTKYYWHLDMSSSIVNQISWEDYEP